MVALAWDVEPKPYRTPHRSAQPALRPISIDFHALHSSPLSPTPTESFSKEDDGHWSQYTGTICWHSVQSLAAFLGYCFVRWWSSFGINVEAKEHLAILLNTAEDNGSPRDGTQRIAKYIAASGVCSRRAAERLIEAGKVKVDGLVIATPALTVTAGSVVEVDGKVVRPVTKPRLWVYYKPSGLVTTHRDERGRPTVFEGLAGLPRVISVGRLDLASEGLLLLTTSGALARYMELPANQLERTYAVWAAGDPRWIENIGEQVLIDGVYYRPRSVKLLRPLPGSAWYEVVLTEGRKREVRLIFSHFGLHVLRLIRTTYGPYELGDLQPGEYREVDVLVPHAGLEGSLSPETDPGQPPRPR
eukprot:EG_transcript_15107